VVLRAKLSLRDSDGERWIGEGGEVDVTGVVAPEGSAVDSPKLVAGVDGGGSGPAGESLADDQCCGRSCMCPRWCLWAS